MESKIENKHVSVGWQLERFAEMIELLCPKYGPLRSVFCCPEVIESESISPRTVEATVNSLKTMQRNAGLLNWPIEYIALEDDQAKRPSDKELVARVTDESTEPYFTDMLGRPVIYFESERMSEPGYILDKGARALTMFIRRATPAEYNAERSNSEAVSTLVSGFLGLGLPIASAAEDTDPKLAEMAYLSSAIFLSIKGTNAQRAHAVYFPQLSEKQRLGLKTAYAKLSSFADQISILRASTLQIDAMSTRASCA